MFSTLLFSAAKWETWDSNPSAHPEPMEPWTWQKTVSWPQQGSLGVYLHVIYRSALKASVPCAVKQKKGWGHCPSCSPSSVFSLVK